MKKNLFCRIRNIAAVRHVCLGCTEGAPPPFSSRGLFQWGTVVCSWVCWSVAGGSVFLDSVRNITISSRGSILCSSVLMRYRRHVSVTKRNPRTLRAVLWVAPPWNAVRPNRLGEFLRKPRTQCSTWRVTTTITSSICRYIDSHKNFYSIWCCSLGSSHRLLESRQRA